MKDFIKKGFGYYVGAYFAVVVISLVTSTAEVVFGKKKSEK